MKKMVYWIVVVTLLTACSTAEKKSETADKENTGATPVVQTLGPQAYEAALKDSKDPVLIDVRTPEEAADGIIPGAVNIDFQAPDFETKISTLDKSKAYFLYCAKGGRSSKAVDLMRHAGFKNLTNLDGGFVGWKEKGMPVEQK